MSTKLMGDKSKVLLVPKQSGLRRLLADDPGQFLLYSVEAVQAQAHYRRVGRVLKRTRRHRQYTGWVHASELQDPCDRVLGAKLLGHKLPREKITPQLERIFDNGTYMHLRWQNYFMSLPPTFKVVVSPLFRAWPVIGEADVTVTHKMFGKVIVELKSMNEGQFKGLKEPLADHFAQANTYACMSRFETFQVWYENKNTQDVKPFHCEVDGEMYASAVDRAYQIALQVLEARLPKGCGKCDYDDYIADLPWDEKRAAVLRKELDEWQASKSL